MELTDSIPSDQNTMNTLLQISQQEPRQRSTEHNNEKSETDKPIVLLSHDSNALTTHPSLLNSIMEQEPFVDDYSQKNSIHCPPRVIPKHAQKIQHVTLKQLGIQEHASQSSQSRPFEEILKEEKYRQTLKDIKQMSMIQNFNMAKNVTDRALGDTARL